MSDESIKSFSEFYPYYLEEHKLRSTRILHFIGTSLALICLLLAAVRLDPWYILYGLICGYFFAWIGHFFFEKNKPATFKYPLWSLASDFKLYFDIIAGKQKF